MNLLSKSATALTPEEQNDLSKPLGIEGIPYPEVSMADTPGGTADLLMSGHIPVISNRSHEDVIALAYTNMPVWGLLEAERKIMEKMNPASQGFFTLVVSGPGWGKTEGAQNISLLMDDRKQPYMFVNCANRDLEELLWETVIDLGEGYKDAIYERMKNGTLKSSSVKTLEEELGPALIKDASGKIVGIDETKIAIPEENETQKQALDRDLETLRLIAENEGIPTQAQNAMGMRKIFNRQLEKAMAEGRILIWDEFTKDEQGSESPLLEFIQWANGMGRDTITLRSTFSVNGKDETAERVLSRKDRAAGCQIIATGNPDDAMLQRFESSPVLSRMDQIRMDAPTRNDWEHRVSQILTGAPLSTHVAFFSAWSNDDPEEFSEQVRDWREKKALLIEGKEAPLEQMVRLKNWEQTRKAVQKLAESFDYIDRCFNTKSDLHIKDADETNPVLDEVRGELRAGFSASNPVDPRLFVRLVQEAENGRSLAQKIDPDAGVGPVFNFRAARFTTQMASQDPLVTAALFGTRLEKAIERWVIQVTADMPETRKVLKNELHLRGVAFTTENQEDTVGKLLNQDMYTDLGGIKSVVSLREILTARLKQTNPALREKSDEEVMPMDKAAVACEELKRLSSEKDSSDPRQGRIVILGKDLDHVFNEVSAVDSIGSEHEPALADLVSSSDFLESLKIPAVANMNMAGIWRKTISAENLISDKSIVQLAEGTHSSKVGITTVMMQSANDNSPVPTHIMLDETRKKGLIVTDVADSATKAALGNEFTIVTYDDINAESQVASFINQTLQHPSRKSGMVDLERQLVRAFALRASNEGELQPLAQMLTTRNLPAQAPVYMVNRPL